MPAPYFNIKKYLALTLMFVLFTVIGTLTHELGHYAVAKYLRYSPTIHYNNTSYVGDETVEYLNDVYDHYATEMAKGQPYPGKEQYEATIDKIEADELCITLGGPLQTLLTGSIGLLLLLWYRSKWRVAEEVTKTGWLFIFLSLFWLRPVANLCVNLFTMVTTGQPSVSSDEVRLANALNLNTWSIQIVTAGLGLMVLYTVIKLLPKKYVVTFLFAGLTGGLLGYYLWLIKLGPYFIP